MLCMPLAVSGFPIADEVFADTSSGVDGSGTADDPYRGDFTGGEWTYLDLQDKYVAVGSQLYVYYRLNGSLFTSWVSSGMGPGLSYVYVKSYAPSHKGSFLVGELTQVGDIVINTMDVVYASYRDTPLTWTLHVVDPDAYPVLEFLSDPTTDGIISYGDSAELIANEDAHENQSQEGSE